MTLEEMQLIQKLRESGAGYKAISTATGISRETIKTFLTRDKERCHQCGCTVKTMPHRKQKKFCSDKCRMAWWAAHPEMVRRKAYYTCKCVHCGEEFKSYGNSGRIFCSRNCHSEHMRRN